ncbi:MAG: GbsR/MarR family transcriptional regulator [Aggregatilineales bacterium]
MSDDRAGERNPNLALVHDSMLDGLGQLAEYLGFSKVMGQLYGALLMSAEPLCLDDMMELLGISKASVSMNMRTLEHMGMVRQVWVRGRSDRRKFYEAETDFWQIISNILSRRELRDLDRALAVMNNDTKRLAEAMPTLSKEDAALAALYMERIGKMQALFKFAQMMIATVLARAGEMDLEEVSGIELRLNGEPEPDR